MAEEKKGCKERKEKKGEPIAGEEEDIDKRVIDYWLAEGKARQKDKEVKVRKVRTDKAAKALLTIPHRNEKRKRSRKK